MALLGVHNRATCAHFSAPAAVLGLDVAAALDDGHAPTSWACAWRSAVGTRTCCTTNCCMSKTGASIAGVVDVGHGQILAGVTSVELHSCTVGNA